MSTPSRVLYLFLALITSLTSLLPLSLRAQDMPQVFVRDVVLENVSYASGDIVRGKAQIANDDAIDRPSLKYIVRVVGAYDESDIPQEEYVSKTFGPISVSRESTREVPFDILIPVGVAGTVGIDVQVVLADGYPLGWHNQKIEIPGVQSFVSITTATMKVDDAPFPVEAGPTLKPGERATLVLKLKGAALEQTLTPVLTIYNRTVTSDPLLRQNFPSLSLPSNTIREEPFDLPLLDGKPGVYAGTLQFLDAGGSPASSIVTFRYIISGDIATIKNVSTDILSPTHGDTVNVSVQYAGAPLDIRTGETYTAAPATLSIKLFNQGGEIVGEASSQIELLEDTSISLPVTVQSDASSLISEVTIVRNGEVLASLRSVHMPSEDPLLTQLMPRTTFTSALILCVILLALVWIYRLIHKSTATNAPLAVLAFGIVVAGTITYAPPQINALTRTINKWIPDTPPPGWTVAMINPVVRQGAAGAAQLFVNSPGGTLSAGQTFYVQGSVRSERCSNTPQYLYVEATYNNQKKTFQRTMPPSGGEVHTMVSDRFSFGPFNAPTTPGMYRIYIGAARAAGPMSDGSWYTGGEYGYREFRVLPVCEEPNTHLSGTTCVCDSGYTLDANGRCVRPATPTPTSCPSGQILMNGVCTTSSCPQYYTRINGTCIRSSCPAGQTLVSGNCVPSSEEVGLECTLPAICIDARTVRNQCSGQETVCPGGWSCTAGACLPSPDVEVNIRANPSLIARNGTTQVTWSSENASLCSITENNPNVNDSWNTLSGTEQTSGISVTTTYTIICVGEGGSATDETSVTINPAWNEN